MGHSDREEEGLTRHRGPAWTEGRLVCPGSRGLKRRQELQGHVAQWSGGTLAQSSHVRPSAQHQGRCSQGAGKGPGKAQEGSLVLRAT